MSKTKVLSLAAILPLGLTLLAAPPASAATASVPSSFTFNGAGWGHGVGMSQYGAYGMALEGYNSTQILQHYYNPAKVTSTSSYANKDILVQLIGGQSSTTLTPKNGQLRVKFGKTTINSSKGVSFAVSGSNIKVKANGKSHTVKGSTGISVEWQNTRYWKSGSADTTVSVPKANGGSRTGNYRHGKMTVKLLNKKLNVVNSLRLNDEYLYGLAEVPSSWPKEALEAQAIAGRTYAMRNMSIKSACGCNVYDEVKSQKFTGWDKENESNGYIGKKWVSAVDSTQSKKSGVPSNAKVVLYKNSLIDAVYSSSTGGKTRSAKDVWGNDHAYLQSRDDRWALKPETRNPNRAWSSKISQSTAAKGYKLPDVKKISVKRAKDHTVASSTAVSSSGKTSTLSGPATRSLFKTKSKWFIGISTSGDTLPATDGYKTKKVPANVKHSTTNNVNFRSGPSTSYGSLKVLPKGASVTTTGLASGGWTQIKSGSTTGWVSTTYIKKTTTAVKPKPKPSKPTTVKTTNYKTTANLNARSGASTKYKSKGVFKKGTTLKVHSISKGWAKVSHGKGISYVSSSYIKKVSSSNPPKTPSKVKTTNYKTTANLNARSGASVKYKSKGVFKKGTTLKVHSISKGWAKVSHGKGISYVSSSYIKKVSTTSGKAPSKVKTTNYKTTANLNARSGASTKYRIKGVFKKGTTLKVHKISKGWAKVSHGKGTSYVSSSYIKKASSSTSKTSSKKTTANLNMRTGASTGHKVIRVIPKSKSVKLTGKTSGKWKQVSYGHKTGWVSGTYLR